MGEATVGLLWATRTSFSSSQFTVTAPWIIYCSTSVHLCFFCSLLVLLSLLLLLFIWRWRGVTLIKKTCNFLFLLVLLNLDMNFDETKCFSPTCQRAKARYFSLASLPKYKPLSIQDQEKVIHSVLSSYLDYCKWVYTVISHSSLSHLQPEQISALGFCLDSIKLTTPPSCSFPPRCQFISEVALTLCCLFWKSSYVI